MQTSSSTVARQEPTEAQLVAGLQVLDPYGQLINWNRKHGVCVSREDLAAALTAMAAVPPSAMRPMAGPARG